MNHQTEVIKKQYQKMVDNTISVPEIVFSYYHKKNDFFNRIKNSRGNTIYTEYFEALRDFMSGDINAQEMEYAKYNFLVIWQGMYN